jgi:Putative transposase, YhgA-like
MKTLRINFDYWWKRLTTEFTPEFIQFFISQALHDSIDWTHPPEYLEQELTAAFTDSATNKKITDKLIRLKLKDGKMKFIFVHIEFQGKSGKAFLRRMFWYCVYIMSKYKTTDITAVVIYTGDDVTKVYDRFDVSQHGTTMSYIFNAYVVSKQNEADLMASSNPMAIAVLANLYVNKTRSDLEKRAEYKKKLFELAKLKGFSAAKAERLLTFVLHLMQLPKELEAEMKLFYKKNKKSSIMSTTTQQAKPRRKKLTEDEIFIRDLVHEWHYGKSSDEVLEDLVEKAKEILKSKAEQDTFMAEQAKVMAEQAKVMAEQQARLSITTMFQKTGWSADKIADIGGFSLDLVQKTLAELNA